MLQLKELTFSYQKEPVLDHINLEVISGEILCLLGESGSGKSTLLRLIAGLEQDYQGQILYEGHDVRGIPTHNRNFGFMFQDFALFPHMSVAQNIEFPLKMRHVSAEIRRGHVAEILKLVGLVGFENRDVTTLSGGEKQRVALARSVTAEPRLLMLDEPLGSLDASLRSRLWGEVRKLIKQIGLTAIYVTHDQEEAYAIADRIAIMQRGSIAQIATPQGIYREPRTTYIAQFLGLDNILPAKAILRLCSLEIDTDYALIHPDGIRIVQQGSTVGTVLERVFRGVLYHVLIQIGDDTLACKIPTTLQIPDEGERVFVEIDPQFVVCLQDVEPLS